LPLWVGALLAIVEGIGRMEAEFSDEFSVYALKVFTRKTE
jgi:hypothetical protein